MKKALGVDYGDARTGLAVSDTTGLLASGLSLIKSGNPDYVAKKIAEAAREKDVGFVVMGRPLNMNGTEGPRVQKTDALAELLRAELDASDMRDVTIEFIDERRSTVFAHQILRDSGKKERQHKDLVDMVAAELILETWLAKRRTAQ